MIKFTSVIVMIMLLLISTAFGQSKVENLELSARDIRTLDINAGAGFLKLKGEKGLDKIEVRAEIVIRGFDEDDFEDLVKDYVDLSLDRRGSRAQLIAKFDNNRRSFFRWSRNRQTHINLTIRVPYEMELYVDDGSGDATIENIRGDMTIDDGSGNMEVSAIVGDVEIDDGSGDLYISDVSGSLRVDDSSGDLEIVGVKGDVEIDDSSGSIHVREIGGSVIVSDGSGSIDIAGVNEDVVIREDGSGGVDVSDVRGRVRRRDR